jgi:hypothetical protein
VAGKGQGHARRNVDENVRLVREQYHGVIGGHLVKRARQIVVAAKFAAHDTLRDLVPEARDPEAGIRAARFSRRGNPTLSNARRTAP